MAYTAKILKNLNGYRLEVLNAGHAIHVQTSEMGVIADETELKAILKAIVVHYKAIEIAGPLDGIIGTEYSEADLGII